MPLLCATIEWGCRVDRLITISAPNQGTWLACLGRKPSCLEMRPRGAFLTSRNRDTESLTRIQFMSIWTPLDLMIVPASSSSMPGRSRTKVLRTSTSPYDFAGWLFQKNRGLPFEHRILSKSAIEMSRQSDSNRRPADYKLNG